MTPKTQFLIALSGTLTRTAKRLEAERAKPPDTKGRTQVPFWTASLANLEALLEAVCFMSPDDAEFERLLIVGPWDAMVRIATRETGQRHYASAILAHAEARTEAKAERGNVVEFRPTKVGV